MEILDYYSGEVIHTVKSLRGIRKIVATATTIPLKWPDGQFKGMSYYYIAKFK